MGPGGLIVLAGLAAGLLYPTLGGGAIAKKEATRHEVRQILVVQYDTRYCRCSDGFCSDFAYKVNSVSRRWYRQSLRRRVSSASSRMHAHGLKCNGDTFDDRRESTLAPCFGCEGYDDNWTPDYVAYPDWPYVYAAEQPDYPVWHLRFRLVGTVKNADGDVLGTICTKLVLFGIVDC